MGDVAGVLVLVARIVIGLYFIIFAGILGHVMRSKGMEGYASAMRFPVPGIAGWPTGIWLVVGGISVAFGIYGDIGSLMIIAFLLLAAAWFHRFWQVGEDMKLMQTASSGGTPSPARASWCSSHSSRSWGPRCPTPSPTR